MSTTSEAGAGEELRTIDGSFVWDNDSHLYFHASSGFYHDPVAGWYYSSRDGVYYTIENGGYVPLDLDSNVESGGGQCGKEDQDELVHRSAVEDSVDTAVDDDCSGELEDIRPPSEWLEETLINLYLTGHPKLGHDEDIAHPEDSFVNCLAIVKSGEIEGDQQVSDDNKPSTSGLEQLNEENWRAQFGQVVKSENKNTPNFTVIDLWDWLVVSNSENPQDQQLVGRLTRQSKKLHPSLGRVGLLRTAKICGVYLDMVRVSTGKIYRLRNPSAGYLASLPAYDASNPTKDWDFPALSFECKSNASQMPNDMYCRGAFGTHDLSSKPGKSEYPAYRDRAAERRALHGGYGIGLGEKRQKISEEEQDTKVLSEVEAINMSCGPGSYSRRILESMGWKEGQSLGRGKGGLLEPLQARGNRGSIGLGYGAR